MLLATRNVGVTTKRFLPSGQNSIVRKESCLSGRAQIFNGFPNIKLPLSPIVK